jgi:hypothetical protein
MAIHKNIPSMLQESLLEMLLVAKYCIEFRKDTSLWPAPGCYGYPAALLLLSIADSIGSYIEKGNVKNHFKILNNASYYNLSLSDDELKIIYENYRNLLSHHTVMATNVGLRIGSKDDLVLQKHDNRYWLNLIPFYNRSVTAVKNFLNNPKVLDNNPVIENIYRKR